MTFHVPNAPATIMMMIARRVVTVRRLGVTGLCSLALAVGYQGYSAVAPAEASLAPDAGLAGPVAQTNQPLGLIDPAVTARDFEALTPMHSESYRLPHTPIDTAIVPEALPDPSLRIKTPPPHDLAAQEISPPVLMSAPLEAVSVAQPDSDVSPALAEQTASPFAVVDTRKDASNASRLTIVLGEGETFVEALTNAGASREDALGALDALRPDFEPDTLQAGDTIELVFSPDGNAEGTEEEPSLALALLTISSQKRGPTTLRWNARSKPAAENTPQTDIAATEKPVLAAPDHAFIAATARTNATEAERPARTAFAGAESALKAAAKLRQLPKPDRKLALVTGTIDSSLYEVASQQGLSPAMIAQLIDIFRYTIDFERDIRKGDSFELLIDRRKGDKGVISYAALNNRGRQITLYRGQRDDGRYGYFDAEGRTNKRSLIRTPVTGARISSRYGMRLHPIHGYNKMHKGVDFAARTGTAIMAAGDGVVDRIGWNGGYGRYIRIRHDSTYHTAYAHMSKFAKGLKKGSRVQQGQTIGYVGSTGNSTGPHLHFEVLKKGRQMNPMKMQDFSANKLAGAQLKRFQRQRLRTDVLVDSLRAGDTLVAQAE